MSGLNGSLSIALSALLVNQQELETSANNVANANTPGFSRQRPDLVPGDPVVIGGLTIGTGVDLQKLESLRDPILELRIQQETQNQGRLDSTLGALQQLQVGFSGTDSGIGDSITKFFDSLQQLSTDPTNVSLRQAVLTAAGNLATGFNTEAQHLQSQRSNLDLNVVETVNQVNTLTAQIAGLNKQIATLENVHENAGLFIDQRNEAIRQLSGLIDVSVTKTESSVTLTTSNGTALVAGDKSFQLTAQISAPGIHSVFAGTVDITASITAGKLGGLLNVRDRIIPSFQNSLDQLAAGLANALNAANRAGFDLNGTAGTDIFVPPPAGGAGAAAGLTVAITDLALVAASSDGTPGSNGNLAVLSAVHDQAVVNGQKPLDFYSSLVFKAGNSTANASADSEASALILRQFGDQRASISGVSLDEEATNIIKYQAAYQASARVVTTVSTLLDLAVNLGKD
jgi:flagellar hook-associated protein 1 FlgK